MILYITKDGWKESVMKFLKIVAWYMASTAVTIAGAYAAGYNIVDEKNGIIIGSLMLVNAGLASVSKWLGTNKPEGVIDTEIIG